MPNETQTADTLTDDTQTPPIEATKADVYRRIFRALQWACVGLGGGALFGAAVIGLINVVRREKPKVVISEGNSGAISGCK